MFSNLITHFNCWKNYILIEDTLEYLQQKGWWLLQSFNVFLGLVSTGFACCPAVRRRALKMFSSSFNELWIQILLWNHPRLMLELLKVLFLIYTTFSNYKYNCELEFPWFRIRCFTCCFYCRFWTQGWVATLECDLA